MSPCLIKLAILDGLPTARLLVDLKGHEFSGALISEPVVDVDEPVFDELDQLEAAYKDKLAYVEPTLAPRGISVDPSSGSVSLKLGLSNYARFAAAGHVIAGLDPNRWLEIVANSRMGTPVALTHSLGVNCTLETADGRLVWTKRSASTFVDPGAMNVAVSEGATPDDADGYVWHPEATLRRGLREELGLTLEEGTFDVTFHSLVCQLDTGGHSVLGHVVVPVTAVELVQLSRSAGDRHELDGGLFFTAADPVALADFVDIEPKAPWTSWSSPALLGLMDLRFDSALLPRIGRVEYDPSTSSPAAELPSTIA